MKRSTRKLLSLLMAFALVCSMIPAALAEEGGDSNPADPPAEHTHTADESAPWQHDDTKHWKDCKDNDGGKVDEGDHSWGEGQVTKQATCKEEGVKTFTCSTCGATKTEKIDKLTTHTPITSPSSKDDYVYDATGHYTKCSICGAATGAVQAHSYGNSSAHDGTSHWYECSVCGYQKDKAAHAPSTGSTYTWSDNSNHKYTCACGQQVTAAHTWAVAGPDATDANSHLKYCTACDAGTPHSHAIKEPHTFAADGYCTVCKAPNQKTPVAGVITGVPGSLSLRQTYPLSFIAYSDSTKKQVTQNRTGFSFSTDSTGVISISNNTLTPVGVGTAKVYLYLNSQVVDSITVTVKNSANVSVTIPQNLGTYAFTDASTTEGSSIYDQIVAALGYNYTGTWYPSIGYPNYNYGYDSYGITIKQTSTGNAASLYGNTANTTLGTLGGVSLSISGTGTWTGSYSVYAYTGIGSATTEVLSGNITVKIEPATGMPILYTASVGESVALDINDFYTFWNEATNGRGTLQSVTINSVNVGTVGGTLCANHSAGERTHTNASGRTYYVSPTGYNQNALGSLTFFPGTNNRYKTGSVTISFTATGSNYYVVGTGTRTTSCSGTVTILYTNGEVQPINYPASTSYTALKSADFDAVYQQATGTTTRYPNYSVKFLDVPTYGTLYTNFTVNSRTGQVSGTELTSKNIGTAITRTALDKMAYVPGYRGVGDSIRYAVYSGSTLQYVGTVNFGVGKLEVSYSCGASGVAFKASDFFSTSGTLLTSQYITFGTPSSGTLYKGGSTRVYATDKFGYTANAASGVLAINTVTYVPNAGFNGTVEIPFTSVTYTGGKLSGTVKIAVTTKTFTDVPATHWAYTYVSRLVAEGVVSGTTPTTYSPGADVKYGEALKMILIAAGYPAQSEGSGSNWAANYLTLAYNNGIVSSRSVDLNKAIDRNTIAEIAAKALKLGSASRINTGIIAPTDSTNGYVYALYNAGIVAGDSSSGRNCYYGSRSITRAEVAKVICNVSDYHSSHK